MNEKVITDTGTVEPEKKYNSILMLLKTYFLKLVHNNQNVWNFLSNQNSLLNKPNILQFLISITSLLLFGSIVYEFSISSFELTSETISNLLKELLVPNNLEKHFKKRKEKFDKLYNKYQNELPQTTLIDSIYQIIPKTFKKQIKDLVIRIYPTQLIENQKSYYQIKILLIFTNAISTIYTFIFKTTPKSIKYKLHGLYHKLIKLYFNILEKYNLLDEYSKEQLLNIKLLDKKINLLQLFYKLPPDIQETYISKKIDQNKENLFEEICKMSTTDDKYDEKLKNYKNRLKVVLNDPKFFYLKGLEKDLLDVFYDKLNIYTNLLWYFDKQF